MFWYEDEVKRLEAIGVQKGYKADTIFYGSSSIRLWDTLDDDFKELLPVNLGFGGSTMAASVWFFDRIMAAYEPKMLVVYAGDNDLGDGRHPEEVFIFFQQLAVRVQQRFGNLPCYYISLKPSINRYYIIDQFKFTNELIENEIAGRLSNWKYINVFSQMLSADGRPEQKFFLDDGLHLSTLGYALWRRIITNKINADK